MEVIGYKSLEKGLKNRYQEQLEIGKTYVNSEKLIFGKNGYHLCKNIEDTLRYYDSFKTPITICQVKGSGLVKKYNDEYYGYYDMYAVEKLSIIRELSRKEIIETGLNLHPERAKRFLMGYKLTKEEIEKFKYQFQNYQDVLNVIAYYQEKDLEIYKKRYLKYRKT